MHKQELWLLHCASRLIVLTIYVKFHKNILISFNVIERTGHSFLQGSKGVTKKIHTQELWFLRFARRPIKLNIRMKFHEDILNVFQVKRRTRFCDERTAMAKTMSPVGIKS